MKIKVIKALLCGLLLGVMFFWHQAGLAEGNISVRIVDDGKEFAFTQNDIQEVSVRRGAFNFYAVIATLNKSLHEGWKRFTSENVGKKFEVIVDEQVTNEGTIRVPIDNGMLAIKGQISNKKEATAFAAKLKKKVKYEDIKKSQEKMLQANKHINKGMRYLEQGNPSQAIIEYNKAIKIDPIDAASDPKVYFYRGMAYARQKDIENAVKDYSKAIELDPTDSDFYCSRAGGYMVQKKIDKAFADFNKAIEVNPNSGRAYQGRAVIYFEKKEFEKCEKDIDKARKLGYEVPPQLVEALKKAKENKK